MTAAGPHFNGPEYVAAFDHARLSNQLERVRSLMLDGRWRTLGEIESITGDPAASVSALLLPSGHKAVWWDWEPCR